MIREPNPKPGATSFFVTAGLYSIGSESAMSRALKFVCFRNARWLLVQSTFNYSLRRLVIGMTVIWYAVAIVRENRFLQSRVIITITISISWSHGASYLIKEVISLIISFFTKSISPLFLFPQSNQSQ